MAVTQSGTERGWRSRHLRMLTFALVVFAVLFTRTALLPQGAVAHASLIATDPANGAVLESPPEQVTLSFTEPVEPIDGGYQLFDSDGPVGTLDVAPSGDDIFVMLPDDLPDGTYIVGWRVISLDSHPINGTLMFSIGEPGASPVVAPESRDEIVPVMGTVQGIGYVALLAGVGLLWFRAVIVRELDRFTLVFVGVAATVAILAHLFLIPLTTIRATGDSLGAIIDPEMWRVGFRHGTVGAVGYLLAGFLIAMVSAVTKRAALPGVIAGGLIALASLPLVGHPVSVQPRWLMYTSDLLHGSVGAIWFGGLIGLAHYLARRGQHDPVAGVHIVSRFSFAAGVALSLAAISGTVMAVRILETPDALFNTTFGRLLLVKVAVLLIPIALAAWNRFRLVPAVEREPDAAAGWSRLRSTVLGEIAMLVVVLGLTGFLVLQSPRVSDAAPGDAGVATVPFEETRDLGDGTIMITITPGATGENQIVVDVRDADDQPIELVDAVTVQLTLPEAELGPLEFSAEETATPGQYAGAIQMPLEGEWSVSVVTRVSRFEQPITTFTVTIPNVED